MKVKGLTKEIKGVIFDMDGLLVNSERLYWRANIQAAREAHLPIPDDSYLKLVGASSKEMQAFYHRYFANSQLRDEFIKRTDDLVWQWADQGKLKLQAGVQQALDKFDQLGMKMGIASSNYKPVVEKFMWVTGIRQYFSFHLTYQDVLDNNLQAKPAPDIYLLAAEKINLPKDNLLVFEDSSTGVQAAVNAGLACVMIPDLKPATESDRQHALIEASFSDFLNKIS